MTLDCGIFRYSKQPRVISVLSYYLTSLVNLSFCGLYGSVYIRAFGYYLYIGITLSDYKITQGSRKINMENCTKCMKQNRAYSRNAAKQTKNS